MKFVKRLLCTAIHVQRGIQVHSFFHILPDQFFLWGCKTSTSVFPLQLCIFPMVQPTNNQVASSLLELDDVFFKVILESRIKWRGFLDKTIHKRQHVLLPHPKQKAAILCNNSGQVINSKLSSPTLPMLSLSNTQHQF